MPISRSESRRFAPPRTLGSVPSLLVMIVLYIYPLATLLVQIVFPDAFSARMDWRFSLHEAVQVLQDRLTVESLANSFWIGCVAAIVSVFFGTVTAFGAVMARGPVKSLLDTCIWTIFFAPSFVIASGWVILLQGGGVLQQALGLPPTAFDWFFTPIGLFLVMGLRYFPFAHFAVTQAILNVGPEYIRAARLLGAPRRTILFRIWLRLLAPALLAGATIAFAEGFGDFGLASVITPSMQIPLVSYQIYSALYELPVDFSSAALLSLMVVVVTAGALVFQFRWLNRRSYGTISGSSRTEAPVGDRARKMMVALSLAIVLFGLILPFGATLVQSFWKNGFLGFAASNWTFANYGSALRVGSDGLEALVRTAEYALITAAAVMILGLYVGQQMTWGRSELVTRILNNIVVATIAIPGVVLGVGYVFAWNATWLTPLHLVIYGTPACLALAYTAVHAPYAIRLQMSAMAQVSPNFLAAAQVLGARKWRVLHTIVLPLVLETVISTSLIAFTGVMFELPAASLLYPSGQPPYSVLVDHLFADFEWASGSALTIVGMLVVFGSYMLGNYVLRKIFGRRPMTGAWGAAAVRPSPAHMADGGPSLSIAP